jgi:hypothetical protein
MVTDAPVSTFAAPQAPEYHCQTAPVPSVPPETLSVVDDP